MSKSDILAEIAKVVISENSDSFSTFFSFSGHVNGFDLRIYNTGWRDGEEPSCVGYYYSDELKASTLTSIRKIITEQKAKGDKILNDTQLAKSLEIERLKKRLIELGD